MAISTVNFVSLNSALHSRTTHQYENLILHTHTSQVVVLQDASFKIPDGGFGDAFGLSAAEINRILTTSPTFTWVPEYHHEAVLKIQNSVLGGSDQALQLVRELQERDHLFKKAVEKKSFDAETPFDLSGWEKFEILQDFIRWYGLTHRL